MIINKNINIRWHSKNKKYYQSKGYIYTKIGDPLQVSLEDLSIGSSFEVEVLCDYCQKNISVMTYNEYNRRRRESAIKKDACKECEVLKIKESNLANYGVYNIACVPDIKKKISVAKLTTYNEVYDVFKEKGYSLISKKYTNENEKLKFICDIHKEEGIQFATFRNIKRVKHCCQSCRQNERMAWLIDNSLTELSLLIRRGLDKWRLESIKNCNYKCVLTGNRFDHVHHLYSLNNILLDTLEYLNLNKYSQINCYKDDELNIIYSTAINLHDDYPLGVCLMKELHELFHKEYGFGYNIPKQFEEFKTRLKSGEFNDFLEENNLKLVI